MEVHKLTCSKPTKRLADPNTYVWFLDFPISSLFLFSSWKCGCGKNLHVAIQDVWKMYPTAIKKGNIFYTLEFLQNLYNRFIFSTNIAEIKWSAVDSYFAHLVYLVKIGNWEISKPLADALILTIPTKKVLKSVLIQYYFATGHKIYKSQFVHLCSFDSTIIWTDGCKKLAKKCKKKITWVLPNGKVHKSFEKVGDVVICAVGQSGSILGAPILAKTENYHSFCSVSTSSNLFNFANNESITSNVAPMFGSPSQKPFNTCFLKRE